MGISTREVWPALSQFFWARANEIVERHKCSLGELLNQRKKARPVAQARAELVSCLRTHCYVVPGRKGMAYTEALLIVDKNTKPPLEAKELSYPRCAQLLGLDHTAMIAAHDAWMEQGMPPCRCKECERPC